MSLQVPRRDSLSEQSECDLSRRTSWADVFIDTSKPPSKHLSSLPELEYDRDPLATPPLSPVGRQHQSLHQTLAAEGAAQEQTWSGWFNGLLSTVTKSGEQFDTYGKMHGEFTRASSKSKGKGRSLESAQVEEAVAPAAPGFFDGLLARAEHVVSSLVDAQEPARLVEPTSKTLVHFQSEGLSTAGRAGSAV